MTGKRRWTEGAAHEEWQDIEKEGEDGPNECPVEEEKGVVFGYFISSGLVVRASNEDGMKIGIEL